MKTQLTKRTAGLLTTGIAAMGLALGIGFSPTANAAQDCGQGYHLDGATVLLDCGESVCRSLKASGLPWDAIDEIFLSHFHFDHLGGFFLLMQGMWLEKRRKPLPVAMPRVEL